MTGLAYTFCCLNRFTVKTLIRAILKDLQEHLCCLADFEAHGLVCKAGERQT